jgi:phage/plasmid primase-like uncharacterized protein
MNVALNVEQQFAAAMAEHGLVPAEIVADGQLHRFDGPGEKRGKNSGWYVLHTDDIAAGAFGDWRMGLTETWSAQGQPAMTSAERQAHRQRIEQSKTIASAARAESAALAHRKCVTLWAKAVPALPSHPYIAAKAITPKEAKQIGQVVVIPLRDTEGVLRSLQFIQPDGAKRFKSGGTVGGSYCIIGTEPGLNAPLLICEGWATACSLHEATGYPVAAAMNAGNLLSVAQSLRAKLPDVPMTICADDDTATDGNPGLTKACEAAVAVAALLAVPDLGPDRPAGATDFNDLHTIRGVATVQTFVKNASVPLIAEMAEVAAAPASMDDDSGRLRACFQISESGVFYIGIKHDSNTKSDIELPPAWMCDRLEIIGRGEDAGGRGYLILCWNSCGSGTVRITAFPLAIIGECEGWASLRERGLAIATSRAALEKLSGYLQTEGSDELHFVTESGGWTHGAYVLPSGEVLGEPSAPLYVVGIQAVPVPTQQREPWPNGATPSPALRMATRVRC